MTDYWLIIGIIGMVCILLAFSMVQFKKWQASDLVYSWVNLLGSVLLVVYAVSGNAWPFIILNSVWAIVSALGILNKKKHD